MRLAFGNGFTPAKLDETVRDRVMPRFAAH
jgi:hypothetical protein